MLRRAIRKQPGSSPRAWGRCAYFPTATAAPPVHPHVRGADGWWCCWATPRARGSSPRAWGRWSSALAATKRATVHPHVRGADPKFVRRSRSRTAVHPHVRGADIIRAALDLYKGRFIPTCVGQMLVVLLGNTKGTRFIPTCVGQIRSGGEPSDGVAVHPHVRGADAFSTLEFRASKAGSSPRAWGR